MPSSRRVVRAQGSGEARIFVVDDDPEVRWVTAEALRAMGYEVTEAASGRAALTLLERGDPCDLIMMDLAMPGLSGAETVRICRAKRIVSAPESPGIARSNMMRSQGSPRSRIASAA